MREVGNRESIVEVLGLRHRRPTAHEQMKSGGVAPPHFEPVQRVECDVQVIRDTERVQRGAASGQRAHRFDDAQPIVLQLKQNVLRLNQESVQFLDARGAQLGTALVQAGFESRDPLAESTGNDFIVEFQFGHAHIIRRVHGHRHNVIRFCGGIGFVVGVRDRRRTVDNDSQRAQERVVTKPVRVGPGHRKFSALYGIPFGRCGKTVRSQGEKTVLQQGERCGKD